MTIGVNPVFPIILVRTVQASLLALAIHGLLRWPFTGPHALGLVVTSALCLYFAFVFVGPWTAGLPILTHLPGGDRRVALTFDDGPSAETTPLLLDTLADTGNRATFFVIGERVRRHPDLVRRIVAEGHTLGVHGFRHVPFVLLPWKRVGEEIRQTRDAIRQACPDAPAAVWLRPPYGFKTLTLPFVARRFGCRLVTWSVNSRDYHRREGEAIFRTVLDRVLPGDIILMHDGPDSAATVAALPRLLDGLTERGLRCDPLGPG